MSTGGLRVLFPLIAVVGACVLAGFLLTDRDLDSGAPVSPADETIRDEPAPDPPPALLPDPPPDPEPEPLPPDRHPARVRGTVLDLGGDPVKGARIALLSLDLDWRRSVPIAAVTDAEGRFAVGHDGKAAAKRLVVDATGMGYFVDERLLDLTHLGADAEVTVRIEKGRVIAGKAVDCDGKPLAGCAVHILEIRAEADLEVSGARRPVEGHVETDAGGEFSDDGYRRGVYRVFLTGVIDEHEFAVVKEGVEAGETDVDLRFPGFGRRRFTFEDEETRKRISVTEIALDLVYAHTGEDEEYVPWAEFNNREELRLDHLPEGHYRLRLVHPGYERLFSEIFFVEAGSDPGEICHRLRRER